VSHSVSKTGTAMPCPYELSLRFRDCSRLMWRPASEGGPYNSPLMTLACLPSCQLKVLEVEERIYKGLNQCGGGHGLIIVGAMPGQRGRWLRIGSGEWQGPTQTR